MVSDLYSLPDLGVAMLHLHYIHNAKLRIPDPNENELTFFPSAKGFWTNELIFRAPVSKIFQCTPFPLFLLKKVYLQSWTKISRQNLVKKNKK